MSEGKVIEKSFEDDTQSVKNPNYRQESLLQKELIDDDDQQIKDQIYESLQKIYSEEKEHVKEEGEENKYSVFLANYNKVFKKLNDQLPKEYDTEDEIARGLLEKLKDMIEKELKSKEASRKKLTNLLIYSFAVLGIFVIILTFCSMHYDSKVVLAVISGFFVNTIGLVLVLLKYMFSPSKELYDYTLGIFKRKNDD